MNAVNFLSADESQRQKQFYQAYQPFKETDAIELRSGFSETDIEVVLRAIYRQVLGNAHIMESDRLTVAESQLKQGDLTVREFVRSLAKSELYRSRFFENCYRYRAIELNFKHLLGRAPDSYEEMCQHSAVLDREGFEADIDTYLDSDEYQDAFGDNIVPYYRGYQTRAGQSMVEFTNLFQLLRSASSSDKDVTGGNEPRLTKRLIQASASSKSKFRDISEILAEIFKPKSPTVRAGVSAEEQALRRKIEEQKSAIATLQQQLSQLRPFAAIGATQLKGDGLPSTPDAPETFISLQQQANAQGDRIAKLQDQLADARRYATIGEARLNRWRSRVFNR
ncbi:MAG: phycobilisome rod-core linker polypeptide [Cyanobacteriota bacterium]|nr:phycobilisome rod-core linker polypeptide [Cyanobacteriota bacterium]